MFMKSLRLERHWSQEQLAKLSGLNVRTIQRAEKGESVGLESLKSLAAVFEMSLDELKLALENEHKEQLTANEDLTSANPAELREQAQKQVVSIRHFYIFATFLYVIFFLFILPNYNGGENLASIVVVFLSFNLLIGGLALYVFQPFGEKWEQEKVLKLMNQENKYKDSESKH